jgi:hypothetical protein
VGAPTKWADAIWFISIEKNGVISGKEHGNPKIAFEFGPVESPKFVAWLTPQKLLLIAYRDSSRVAIYDVVSKRLLADRPLFFNNYATLTAFAISDEKYYWAVTPKDPVVKTNSRDGDWQFQSGIFTVEKKPGEIEDIFPNRLTTFSSLPISLRIERLSTNGPPGRLLICGSRTEFPDFANQPLKYRRYILEGNASRSEQTEWLQLGSWVVWDRN